MITIKTPEEFRDILDNNMGVLAYFSHDGCNVCKTLKPKLAQYFKQYYPNIKQAYIDIEKFPALAAVYSVFTVPVVLVFFEGKESFRKARAFGIKELAGLMDRPYSLIFDQ